MTDATWRKSYHSKVDAKVAYAELEKIRAENGDVTPEKVVASAKPAKSPIHKAFTWNNTKAANLYRKREARDMIAAVEIVRVELPDTPTRAYEIKSAPTEDKPQKKVYTTTEEILEDPVARDELLLSAVRDALSYRKRYSMLSELAGIFHAIDDFAENAESAIK